MTAGNYELRQVVDVCVWAAYHRIRRLVFFEARGRFGVYDENRPDERNEANQPILLLFQDHPVCALRLDRMSTGQPSWGLMAVEQTVQRRSHGRAAISLLIELAKSRDLGTLEVNSAPDAVPFYQAWFRDCRCQSARAPFAARTTDIIQILHQPNLEGH